MQAKEDWKLQFIIICACQLGFKIAPFLSEQTLLFLPNKIKYSNGSEIKGISRMTRIIDLADKNLAFIATPLDL